MSSVSSGVNSFTDYLGDIAGISGIKSQVANSSSLIKSLVKNAMKTSYCFRREHDRVSYKVS